MYLATFGPKGQQLIFNPSAISMEGELLARWAGRGKTRIINMGGVRPMIQGCALLWLGELLGLRPERLPTLCAEQNCPLNLLRKAAKSVDYAHANSTVRFLQKTRKLLGTKSL